ncbi:tRNA-dihydrouridine synthase [Ferrimonas lipolytica]|uniref:tRNA-dihydrouridine(16) synthase n=1 Tax=Ferrimonas lipolytica TaxID=2724191 RepID=A0A6H1UB70_9GAMM|nr:tRNA-dihydrouridine synthase [Ferrimonas lipolytica]QIZ75889.1 tRNA dihydrouridine(16) synthase DusC [Ferrimonas lipolytica]
MRVILAPMEGVMDALMRDMLTRQFGVDMCVSEFVRVVDQLLPERTYRRLCPELNNGGKTPAGVPVRVQLLGQNPDWMALNAARAVELGSDGVDLNFGCPAKQVNQSKGGAVLLKEPQALHDIIKAVRDAVPSDKPVTAKIRLGFNDKDLMMDNAFAAQDAGAAELCVHGRTKDDGYKADKIDWESIGAINNALSIPVIANGEIWSAADAKRCREITGSKDLMIGRGALALPNLAECIKTDAAPLSWQEMKQVLIDYSGFELYGDKGIYYPNRIKQWFRYLIRQYPEAQADFEVIRRLRSPNEIVTALGATHLIKTQA